ncbi:ninjurin-1-like [Ptychodera flava]|uniref:ninjurin-1-like n=1 Tax=Ptychodera flava TaxID=63121 RepID=UPI00396A705A
MESTDGERESTYLLGEPDKQSSPTGSIESTENEGGAETRPDEGANEAETQSVPKKKVVSVNSYTTKKTFVQGLLDMSLLASNVVVLRFILLGKVPEASIYYLLLVFVCLSICIQFVVAVLLFFKITHDVTDDDHRQKLDFYNNIATFFVMLLTFMNVFICVFSSNMKCRCGLSGSDESDQTSKSPPAQF